MQYNVHSDVNIQLCLAHYVNIYYHYQLIINAVHILCSSFQYTTTVKSICLFDTTFAMKIQTADIDACNKKVAVSQIQEPLSTEDNLTPQLQGIRKTVSTE